MERDVPVPPSKAQMRRGLLVLLAVLLCLAPRASSADFACTASVPATPSVRADGLTELVGDIVVRCTGGSPTLSGQTIPASSLMIVLNTAVTSHLMGNSSVNSEALLLIDEPGSQSNPAQSVCATPATGCTVTGGSNGRPNIFQGTVSGSSVTFAGVPIDPPGNGTRVYRIVNIRANASGITPGPGGAPGVIIATILAGGPAALPNANPTLIAAYVQAGMNLSVRDSANAGALAA